jgi:uncharacterized protein
MYNMADKSYLSQPKFMSEAIQDAFAERLVKHAQKHKLDLVFIVLHGGEPLLFGKERLRRFTAHVSATLARNGVDVSFGMQSNGTLIDEEWVDLLADQQVTVGISLDGPEHYHNIFRVDHSGRGSFARVMQGIHTLQNHRRGSDVFAGLLAVMNTSIPPKDFYRFIKRVNPPAVNVLFPHANYAHPPAPMTVPYGEWLKELFDLWYRDDIPEMRIDLFANALRLIFGGAFGGEALGAEPISLVVIETNGDIEPSDNLKPCGHNFTKTGLNVLRNNLDDALKIPLIDMACKTSGYLCSTCKRCELVSLCGGGQAVQRYSIKNGFDNPSIYCEDYKMILRHILQQVRESIPADLNIAF